MNKIAIIAIVAALVAATRIQGKTVRTVAEIDNGIPLQSRVHIEK